jgi:hypothetical protein
VIVGHGLRRRQVRGPDRIDAEPVTHEIDGRRYRCGACESVILVVPRGVAARRHFRAEAIAIALWLYGVLGLTAAAVRTRVAGAAEASGRFRSLVRWIAAVADGQLFGGASRPWPAHFSRRQKAERTARALEATAPPGTSPEVRLVLGAAHAA